MNSVRKHRCWPSIIGNSKYFAIILCVIFGLMGCADKTAQEHLLEAKAFSEQGNNAAAVVALKNAIQKAPRDGSIRFALGQIYLLQNNFESAEKELSRALEFGHPASQVIPALAEALQRSGANVALSEIDTENADLTPAEQLEVGFRKLQSLVQLEQNVKAQTLVDSLKTVDSNTVYKGLIEGYDLVLDNQFSQALDIAKEMYARAPLNRDVLNFTARLYMLNDEPTLAADIYENYIKVAPDDIESKFALANMLIEQKQPERAEKYIDELMIISANNALLNQMKGVVRAADNDFENAKLYSEKAINAGRSDPSLRLIAGFASYQLEEYSAAVGHLSFVASVLPDNHPGLRILAASQLQSNMGEDAGEILTRVNDINENDASLFSRAGFELLRSGNTNAAKAIIEQADKISESAEDLTRLGVLKLSIDDIEGLVDLESAVAKAPQSATAKTTLASAYLSTEQYDKALQLAQQWQKELPNAVEAYLLESEVYQRQALYDKGYEVLVKASKMTSNNASLDMAFIRLDIRQRNFDAALVKIETLLQKQPSNLNALAGYLALKKEAGNATEGLERVKIAMDNDSKNDALRLLFARASLSFNQPENALQALKEIEANRNAPNAYWPLMGIALIKNNQGDTALKHYEQWLGYFPSMQNAAIGQMVLLDNNREYLKAADIATAFLSRKHNDEITLMQSYFFVMSGNVDGAKRVLNSVAPELLEVPFIKGVQARIAIAEGRAQEGVEDAKVAYNGSKNSANLVVLIRTLSAAKKADEAYQLLIEHTTEFPKDLQAQMLLAEQKIAKGNNAEAIAAYEKVLEQLPNNYVVLNNIAYLEMEAGNLDAAARYGLRAYEMQPDNAATADTYAQILIRQGDIEGAVKAYNRVMNDKVKNEEIMLNYLESLLMNGNKVIAERRMKDYVLLSNESKTRLAELKVKYLQ